MNLENYIIYTAIILLSFLASIIATRYLLSKNSIIRVIDYPNDRSLHSIPVPRTGGLAILVGIAISSILLPLVLTIHADIIYIAIGAFLVAVVSFIDDCYNLSVKLRFSVHGLVAVLLIIGGYQIMEVHLPSLLLEFNYYISIFLTILFIIWLINLYNFMDGIDGFSGGMAVFGFATLSVFGWLSSNEIYFILSLSISAASLGFLLFNFPPAKIFMGDAGSSTIGFLVGAFIIWGNNENIIAFWQSLLIFSPFIVDATVTLASRIINKERFWEAHKTHYYQRLVNSGWSHKKTVLYEYTVIILCSVSAVISVVINTPLLQWAIILIWLLLYCGFAILILNIEKNTQKFRKPYIEEHGK